MTNKKKTDTPISNVLLNASIVDQDTWWQKYKERRFEKKYWLTYL